MQLFSFYAYSISQNCSKSLILMLVAHKGPIWSRLVVCYDEKGVIPKANGSVLSYLKVYYYSTIFMPSGLFLYLRSEHVLQVYSLNISFESLRPIPSLCIANLEPDFLNERKFSDYERKFYSWDHCSENNRLLLIIFNFKRWRSTFNSKYNLTVKKCRIWLYSIAHISASLQCRKPQDIYNISMQHKIKLDSWQVSYGLLHPFMAV